MPRNSAYEYSETETESALDELRELDWRDPNTDHEAAALLDELREQESIEEYIAGWSHVPPERHVEVERLLNPPETVPAETVGYRPSENAELREATQYLQEQGETGLAYQLEQTLQYSELIDPLREQTDAEPSTYDIGKPVREAMLDCAKNIPDALEAQRALLEPILNGAMQRELTERIVNRMTYRLNLEIQDRAMQASLLTDAAQSAEAANMASDIVQKLKNLESAMGQSVANYRRRQPLLTHEEMREAINHGALMQQIKAAIQDGNQDALRELVESPSVQWLNRDPIEIPGYGPQKPENADWIQYQPAEQQAAWDAAMRVHDALDKAAVLNGSKEFHFQYTDTPAVYSNDKRIKWIEQSGHDGMPHAGDCATRALNEITGGERYGEIWTMLTRMKQEATGYQEHSKRRNADTGVSRKIIEHAYAEDGLTPMMGSGNRPEHDWLTQHLDMREIPALLEISAVNPDTNYVMMSHNHVAAIVDHELRDTTHNSDEGDHNKYRKDRTLIDFFLQDVTQDEKERVQATLEKLSIVLKFDQQLTYKQHRRNATAQGER